MRKYRVALAVSRDHLQLGETHSKETHMASQVEKGARFRALHTEGTFLLPNPWDRGSARILAGMGFSALATTSAGYARSTGVDDYELGRECVMAHAREMTGATNLPMTADLENGFGHTPEDCAATIRLAAEAGLVGGSIEDFTGETGQQYDIKAASERITAAVEQANALPFDFTITARAENYFTGSPDLADTISRLQAYQEAGAHCLYAPSLKTMHDIKTVLASIDRPLNVLLGPMAEFVPISQLADIGVRRISVGAVFANLAYGALIKAAAEFQDPGTLGFLSDLPGKQLMELIRAGTPDDG